MTFIQTIGTLHGISTSIQAHGVTDIPLGTTETAGEDFTEGIIMDSTEDTTIHGTMTLGTIIHGVTILGITAILVTMIHSTIICTHTITVGMVHGTHTMEQYITGHHMAAITT